MRPLTARSVIASVLLGTHPPMLPVAALVRAGELFGIAEGTVRVAVSRMTADGELVADAGAYRLGHGFEPRQAAQDRGRRPLLRPWTGSWEVVLLTGRSADPVAESDSVSATGSALDELHLAPAGDRTWLRPANLRRFDDAWPAGVRVLEAPGDGDVAADRELCASLWDLEGWAVDALELLAGFSAADSPAERFVVAAAILRHLRHDPVLPHALLPGRWPADALRSAYSSFSLEMQDLLAITVGGPTRR